MEPHLLIIPCLFQNGMTYSQKQQMSGCLHYACAKLLCDFTVKASVHDLLGILDKKLFGKSSQS
jgi:hypothetical protein